MKLCCAQCLVAGVVILAPMAAPAVDSAVLEAQQRRVDLIRRLAPSVVAVFGGAGEGGGSGVLISADGLALTNHHVAAPAGPFLKCGLNDGRLYDAVVAGLDPTGDVALIKLVGREDFPVARWGDSDAVHVGDWVYVMGNPFLLAGDFQPTVTYGIVSGVHRYQYPAGAFLEYTDCIQVDASINPGNSGGPLFNDRGELIGINGRGSFDKRGRVNVGAGYAISINQIRNFLDHLRGGRIVDHGGLGLTVAGDGSGAVVVADILPRAEAYRRGLRAGDQIVSLAGRPVRSANQFKNLLGTYPEGWTLPLIVRSRGTEREVYLPLERLHRESERPPLPAPAQNPSGEESAGAAADELLKLYEHRAGFANYRFNRLSQERVLAGVGDWKDFAALAGMWQLAGNTSRGEAFEFTLADNGIGLEIGGKAYFQPPEPAEPLDEPRGSGGLLTALKHWRLMLTRQAGGFTEFYYFGSEPLDGRGPRVDVLLAELAGVRSRWYFDRNDGRCVGFDTRLSDDVDACRIRFGEAAQISGRRLPREWSVLCGEQEFSQFIVDRAGFKSGTR